MIYVLNCLCMYVRVSMQNYLTYAIQIRIKVVVDAIIDGKSYFEIQF